MAIKMTNNYTEFKLISVKNKSAQAIPGKFFQQMDLYKCLILFVFLRSEFTIKQPIKSEIAT